MTQKQMISKSRDEEKSHAVDVLFLSVMCLFLKLSFGHVALSVCLEGVTAQVPGHGVSKISEAARQQSKADCYIMEKGSHPPGSRGCGSRIVNLPLLLPGSLG